MDPRSLGRSLPLSLSFPLILGVVSLSLSLWGGGTLSLSLLGVISLFLSPWWVVTLRGVCSLSFSLSLFLFLSISGWLYFFLSFCLC